MHGQGNSFITPQDVTNLVRAVLASRGTFASAEVTALCSGLLSFTFCAHIFTGAEEHLASGLLPVRLESTGYSCLTRLSPVRFNHVLQAS
jgi:hypothetical protein